MGSFTRILHYARAPWPPVIHVIQNLHAKGQGAPWDKTNKVNYHLNDVSFLFALRLCIPCTPGMAVLYHVNDDTKW